MPIGGRVVDPAGRPIAGAVGPALAPGPGQERARIVVDPVAAADGSFVLHTDADGRYRTRGGSRPTANTTPRRRPRAGSRPGRPRSPPPRRLRQAAGPGAPPRPDRRGPGRRPPGPAGRRRPRAAVGRWADADRGPHRGTTAGSTCPASSKGRRCSSRRRPASGTPCSRSTTGRSRSRSCSRGPDEPPAVAVPHAPAGLAGRGREGPGPPPDRAARRQSPGRHGNDDEKYRLSGDAAAIDPHATIEWLDEAKFADPDYVGLVRHTWRRHSPARASTKPRPSSRPAIPRTRGPAGISGSVDVAPNLHRGRRQRSSSTRPAQQQDHHLPGDRFDGLGRIADRLIDLGDVDGPGPCSTRVGAGREPRQGDKAPRRLDLVPRRGPGAARPAGRAQDRRGPGAGRPEERAGRPQPDLRAVLRPDRPQAGGPVAGRRREGPGAHADQPAVGSRGRRGLRRMAPKDLARARRIAETRISPDAPAFRPYALGLMARAIAATDRAEAVRLLDEAFAELERLAATGVRAIRARRRRSWRRPCCRPSSRSRRTAWRNSSAARSDAPAPGRSDRPPTSTRVARTIAVLAMLVARYDRGLAARSSSPCWTRSGSHEGSFGVD